MAQSSMCRSSFGSPFQHARRLQSPRQRTPYVTICPVGDAGTVHLLLTRPDATTAERAWCGVYTLTPSEHGSVHARHEHGRPSDNRPSVPNREAHMDVYADSSGAGACCLSPRLFACPVPRCYIRGLYGALLCTGRGHVEQHGDGHPDRVRRPVCCDAQPHYCHVRAAAPPPLNAARLPPLTLTGGGVCVCNARGFSCGCLAIGGVIITVIGFGAGVLGWRLGILEALVATIGIGFSVDCAVFPRPLPVASLERRRAGAD